MTSAIVVKDLSKRFKIPHHKRTTLFQNVVGLVKRQMTYEEFWALKDVSFEVNRGQTLGIIGRNGSGKSTLLKILAGVLYPDSGSIAMNGKVASFLELGVGFQPELTAKENVYIYSSIMGMHRKQTAKIYEDIFEFAELKRFEDMKLKNFSSGMYLRLAFATAIQTDPDIMLVDEVLAVGDEAFQKKCMRKINEFKGRGKTIILVSHALDTVRLLCDTAILLDNGHAIKQGPTREVIKMYLEMVESQGYQHAGDNKYPDPRVSLPDDKPAATRTVFIKQIGAEHDDGIEAICAGNYLHLIRFAADRSGIIDELRIRCASPGHVKLAIYENINGEPGELINAVDAKMPVSTGWNAIVFPATAITTGKYYWLAYCSDGNIVGARATANSNRRFKQVDFYTFKFPFNAPPDFTIDTTYYDLIAAWGQY